jgi:hypothetical protein
VIAFYLLKLLVDKICRVLVLIGIVGKEQLIVDEYYRVGIVGLGKLQNLLKPALSYVGDLIKRTTISDTWFLCSVIV